MAKSFKEPCPVCGSTIEGEYTGLLTKRLQLPNFCGVCSQSLYTRCPNCQSDLLHLTHHCPNCKCQLYRKTKPPTQAVTILTDHQKKLLQQLRRDMEDMRLFYTEYFRTIIRCNPVNIQIHQFTESINQITENMEGPQIVGLVERALTAINLFKAVQALSDYDVQMNSTVRVLFIFCARDVTPAFNFHREYLPTPAHLEELARSASTNMIWALQSTRNELQVIHQHYRQLLEYFPRYQRIMTRTGFLNFVIKITARILEADAVADLWENWRELSDNDFMNVFQRAFNQFYHSALQFCDDTRKATDPVIHQIISGYDETMSAIIDGIEMLAAAGTDIEPIYQKLRQPETSLDDDTKLFIETVIANLRDQGLSGQSERNLKYLIGLSKN